MWAIVAITTCVCVLFGMYLTLEAERHEREELKKVRKEIEDAEAELEKALAEHGDDFELHAVCKRNLERLRKREADLL